MTNKENNTNTLQPDCLYKSGTKLNVVYSHDGIEENQICILADTFEESFLFQVISIDGYHAGCVEGYIKRQYGVNDLDKTNVCTGSHLQNELKERVFQNIKSVSLIE